MISKRASDTTKAFYKLETFLSFVGNELDLSTEVLVIDAKPISELVLSHDFEIDAALLVFEPFGVFLLFHSQVVHLILIFDWIPDLKSSDINVFPDNDGLDGR